MSVSPRESGLYGYGVNDGGSCTGCGAPDTPVITWLTEPAADGETVYADDPRVKARTRLCKPCERAVDEWREQAKARRRASAARGEAHAASRRNSRREFSHARSGAAPVSSPASDERHNGRGSLAEAFDNLV
jgi:hypothetical protein